jgi:hypothetical protein
MQFDLEVSNCFNILCLLSVAVRTNFVAAVFLLDTVQKNSTLTIGLSAEFLKNTLSVPLLLSLEGVCCNQLKCQMSSFIGQLVSLKPGMLFQSIL